jgi:hypothetical protein
VSGSNGTAPRAISRGHCTDRGSQNEYGTNLGRVCKDGQQRDYSAGIGRTQGEYYVGPNTSNGAHEEVPSDHKRDQQRTPRLGSSGRATSQSWGPIRSRLNHKGRLFWEERHAKGKGQLEGKATRVHAWKT